MPTLTHDPHFQATDFLLTLEEQSLEIENSSNLRREELAGVCLYVGQDLPVFSLVDNSRKQVGWLLGWPIDLLEKKLLSSEDSSAEAPIVASPENPDELRERLLGRYLVLFVERGSVRVIPDTCATLSTAYHRQRPVIASRPILIGCQPRADQMIQELREITENWYPVGLTEWEDVRLLYPNHQLALPDQRMTRSFPHSRGWRPRAISRDEIIQLISDVLQTQIQVVTATQKVCMPLTAGSDSRMMLSASRHCLDKILFFTETSGLKSGDPDWEIPPKLAEQFSLNYLRVSDHQELDQRERVVMLGFGGEYSAGFYWSSRFRQRFRPLNLKSISSRLQFGENPPAPVRQILEEWMNSLVGIRRDSILDLLYQEFRLGCSMSPVLNAYDQGFRYAMYPYHSLNLYRKSLGLSRWCRWSGKIRRDVCRHLWPELQCYPYG